MPIKSKVGDVFLVPLQEGHCVGQIVDEYLKMPYICIFEEIIKDMDISADWVSGKKPLFAHLSLDGLLYHGEWPIIGNYKNNLSEIARPAYKVGYEGSPHVEPFHSKILRPASVDEDHFLRFRNIKAPVILEDAIKSYHGDGQWKLNYADLYYEYAEKTAHLNNF